MCVFFFYLKKKKEKKKIGEKNARTLELRNKRSRLYRIDLQSVRLRHLRRNNINLEGNSRRNNYVLTYVRMYKYRLYSKQYVNILRDTGLAPYVSLLSLEIKPRLSEK